MVVSNRNLLFQGSIFRGYVSFREGRSLQPGFAMDVLSQNHKNRWMKSSFEALKGGVKCIANVQKKNIHRKPCYQAIIMLVVFLTTSTCYLNQISHPNLVHLSFSFTSSGIFGGMSRILGLSRLVKGHVMFRPSAKVAVNPR